MNIKPKNTILHLLKYEYKPIVACLFLWLLLLLPIQMGEKNANHDMLLIGTIESIAQEHYTKILTQITSAWAITKLSSKSIALLQRGEISFTPLGVGITMAPGEILAVVGDNLERISSYLFILMIALFIQQFLLGCMSFLCLKIIIPCALILYILSCFKYQYSLRMQNMASLLFKVGLTLWLFLPLSAMASEYIQQGYIGNTLQTKIEQIKHEKSSLEQLQETSMNPATLNSKTETSLWEKTKNIASSASLQFDKTKEEILQKLYTTLDNLERLVDNLISIIAIFIITNIIIPIATGGIFILILRQFHTSYQRL